MRRHWKGALLIVPTALAVLLGALILLGKFRQCPNYGRRLVRIILLRGTVWRRTPSSDCL